MALKKEDIIKSRMFARQQLLEGWDQKIVDQGCIIICGVGALGCEIAKNLALMGIGKLILVDLDTIETSNLSRQMLFKPGDEGRPKAEVAAERLKQMNPFLKVDYYFEKLQKLPMSIYQAADVVVMALDNFSARMDLNKICLRLRKPLVEGAITGFEGHVQIIIPEDSGVQYKNKEAEIEKIVEQKTWELTEDKYPDYFQAQKQIEELEAKIDKLKEQYIYPIIAKIKEEVEKEFTEKYSPKVLNQTPCYRCVVPVPPPDDKLVAACTLKGLPLNKNHCAIKADVDFEKKYGRKVNFENDDDVLKLIAIAQEELEKLRERVFYENVPEEKRVELSREKIEEWKTNIKETFGPNFRFEELENIIGNKIPAIQTVNAVISSVQSQEILKLLFRAKGRDIGPPINPPYINYNGVYGQFDPVEIVKREDCLACGKIVGEENVQIVVPFDANLGYIFDALDITGYNLNKSLWMISNPMTKEIYWNPEATNPIFKDPNVKLQPELKVRSNDVLTMTPLGKAKIESEIKKYNVVIIFM